MGKIKILQLQCWTSDMIRNNLKLIKDCGYTHIMTSPIQYCKEQWNNNGNIIKYSKEYYDELYRTFWKFYQPYGFEIHNEIVNNENDFIDLCKCANSYGLEIIVDVVTRHLSGDDNGNPIPHEKCDKDIVNNSDCWINDKFVIKNYNNRYETLVGQLKGLPTLNYNNYELQQNKYIPFLDKVMQYASIRIDMAHQISLPSENGTYFTNVIKPLKEKYHNRLIIGECDNANDEQLNEYKQYMLPIIHYGKRWNEKGFCKYFETHDDVMSFMRNLTMTYDRRLNEWENVLRSSDVCLFFARRNDEIMFSNDIKILNNKY